MALPRLLASLVNDARAAGWEVKVDEVDTRVSCTFSSADGSQSIHTSHLEKAFVRAYVMFPNQERRVVLRNLSAARKQMFNPPQQRPVKEKTRSHHRINGSHFNTDPDQMGAPMDARETLGFRLDELTDSEILTKLAGKTIYWRNAEMNRIEHMKVPEELGMARVVTHPRNHRKMLQVMAGLVYLDRIRRVFP